MDENKYTISNAPYIKYSLNNQKILLLVILSLLPATLFGIYSFGSRVLFLLITAIITAWICDAICQYFHRREKFLKINLSSILTGILLTLILPPTTALWVVSVGTIVALVLGKYVFGRGNNVFNPALIGYVFIVYSFPNQITEFIIPDGISSATPLTVLKNEGYNVLVDQFGGTTSLYIKSFIGNIGGGIGETSALLLILGGIFLVYMKIIDLRIPLSYLGTVFILSIIFKSDPWINLLSGGLMIGAIYMATDYVTSPTTRNGRIIFGIGCGVLTIIIRTYSSMPEGVASSILLMNAAAPLINKLTIPKSIGQKEREKLAKENV